MNKEVKAKFKKAFISKTKRKSLADKVETIKTLLACNSFDEYSEVCFNAGRFSDRKYLIKFFITDKTPFTLKDREFIIWTGFMDLLKNPERFRANQQMSLEIFDDADYAMYLRAVIVGEDYYPSPMYKYIENRRKELMISDRLYTIKQIRKV